MPYAYPAQYAFDFLLIDKEKIQKRNDEDDESKEKIGGEKRL